MDDIDYPKNIKIDLRDLPFQLREDLYSYIKSKYPNVEFEGMLTMPLMSPMMYGYRTLPEEVQDRLLVANPGSRMYNLSSEYYQRSKQYMAKKCCNPVTKREINSLISNRLLDSFGYYAEVDGNNLFDYMCVHESKNFITYFEVAKTWDGVLNVMISEKEKDVFYDDGLFSIPEDFYGEDGHGGEGGVAYDGVDLITEMNVLLQRNLCVQRDSLYPLKRFVENYNRMYSNDHSSSDDNLTDLVVTLCKLMFTFFVSRSAVCRVFDIYNKNSPAHYSPGEDYVVRERIHHVRSKLMTHLVNEYHFQRDPLDSSKLTIDKQSTLTYHQDNIKK